jgi:hypothetical protein
LAGRVLAFKRSAVHEEDIEPSIVIEIEKGSAAARGFEKIRIALLATENGFRVESRLARDIHKLHRQRRSKRTRDLIEAEHRGRAGK